MHKTRRRQLALVFGLLCACSPAFGQTDQFLPEVDLYSKVHHGLRFQFQASQTREANQPVQAQFGPSMEWNSRPLPILVDIAKHDLDQAKTRVAVLAVGYRYLPEANGGAATNRLQPVATFRTPSTRKLSFSDRSKFELDWKTRTFTWQYRNRIRAEGPIRIARYHPTPYASVEFYYQSQYGKFSDTAIDVGCLFPIKTHVQIDSYYQHQNETGKSPNQQLDQLGFTVNIYF